MIPVILSGGFGTRLWPLSRTTYPKPFCEILDESFMSKTIRRLKPLGEVWVVTSKNLKVLTEKSLKDHSIPTTHSIYEPQGKNTAPAIALLCKVFLMKNKSHEVVGVFPADHLIHDQAQFQKAVRLAAECAEKGQVCTIGVVPTNPSTAYGYIEADEKIFAENFGLKAFVTKAFHEKPTSDTATTYIKNGKFFWNAGIFVFQISKMAEAFQKHMPKLWSEIDSLKNDFSNLDTIYSRLESKSIDYGVMELLKAQTCIPCDFGWSDLGSWSEIANQGSMQNQTVSTEGETNFAFSEDKNKLFAFAGVDDVVVVDTEDVTLVVHKDEDQKIKQLLNQVEKINPILLKEHTFEVRPWGKFKILKDTEYFKSKIIYVDPGQQFSYQSHAKRAEHWVVVRGQAEVTLNDELILVNAGEHIFIPQGAKHRLKNNTGVPIEFIEVQIGTYFGEDDIKRYFDDYGRT